MKIFLLALSGLLLFDSSQGSILPQEKQIRTLNTTLRTNFSGIYQRKNPCSGSEVETSLYKASHELHHHTKDDSWSDYTHKCSAIIRNFLQTIGNLIKYNNDPTGSFNFYLNTSISQKQRLTGDPNSCESLPTIVIEATDCKIPLSSSSHIPKGESFKYKDAEGRKYGTDQFLSKEILPLADFSGQEDRKDQNTVPVSDAKEIFSSHQSTTQNPSSDWFESEESSCQDDNSKFSTTFSPSELKDISQAVLYDLSRGTQSAYEPKPKFFKTSLKLTPQTDPENGTIQPRIHYMAADLLADPSHGEPSPQSLSESPGSLVPIPFPEGPYYAPISPTQPLEHPPQVPPPPIASAFELSASQNEPIQLSATVRSKPQLSSPPSLPEALAEPTAAPIGKPLFITTDLQPPAQFSNDTPDVSAPQDQNSVNHLNDPEFSFVPVQSQPALAVKYDAHTLNVQTSTYPPQLSDTSPKSTSQNSSPHPTTYSETQAQPNLLPALRQTPQQDFRIQVSQPPVNFPSQPSEVNGEDLNYSTKLNPPPTADDQSDRETLTTNFGNQLGSFAPRDDQFGAQPISPLDQKFPVQLPYDSRLPSTVLLPGVRTYEKGSSPTTPLPPLQYESREGPNYSDVIPEENEEESKDRSITFASRPSANPYVASNLPYSDTLITSTPGLGEIAVPNEYPVNSDSHSGQQSISDGQPTKHFHSSSVTTVEETVTFNQKQTTPIPGIVLEQIPGSTANNFDSSPPGSNFASYKVQQFPSVLPDSSQAQLPGTNPSTITNTEDDIRLLINPENSFKSTPTFNNVEFSTTDSQISDATLSPNNEQVLRMPETSQTVSLPFPQESQLLKPEYDPSTEGLAYMTTPMPYASVPNSGKTILNSPIPSEPSPSSTPGSSSTTIANYLNKYNFQTPSQQLYSIQEPVPADQPLVGYSGQIGKKLLPASDSLVRSDYLTTGAAQPLTGNVDRFITSTPDNIGRTYDPASVSQFTDSQQRNWPPENFEENPSTKSPYWSGPQITEDVSSSLPPSITSRPEEYALHQEQQPFVFTSSESLKEEQFSTDKMSSESAVTELPQAVFSQEQIGKDQNWRTNPADVDSAKERNFQTLSLSTTPVYSNQLPTEEDTKQIFDSQIENKFGKQSPKNPLYSLEHLFDGQQTTDSAVLLRPLSPENTGSTDQYLQPNTFPGDIDATTPASFPPAAAQPNQKFPFNRPSNLADSFVTETTPGKPGFQQSSPNSEKFSNFNSQPLSPGVAVDTSKPQITTIPLAGLPSTAYWNDNADQTTPVSSLLTDSSTEDVPADLLTTLPVDTYAFSTPQDAGTTPNADSPAKYPLQTSEIGNSTPFVTSSTLQPTSIQSFDKSTQTTPPQPFNSVPPNSISSQPQNTGLAIQTPLETPGLSFNQPLLFETNTAQPPTSLPVGPVDEIIPTPPYPEKPGLQYEEEETTSQLLDGTSSGPQPYVNGDSYPQVSFNSQSVESGTSLQETELLSRAEESRSNDFGQNPNYEPVAAGESFAVNSSPLPQRTSHQTTSIQETTSTNILNSDRFSSESTEAPFLEPLQTLPESTAVREIITTQQQSFPSTDFHEPPNYADRSSDEFTNSFDPLVPQEISKPNVQISATADSSSAVLQQQAQSLDLSSNRLLPSTVPIPTVTPELPPTYPDQPTTLDSREVFNSVVSNSVESFSSQQVPQEQVDPVHSPTILPPSLNAESQTLSQDSSNFQERDERLTETSAAVNLQPYSYYNQPGRIFNQQIPNYYNGNLSAPPRALPGGYPAPDHVGNQLLHSENHPPSYDQRPIPQISDSQPSPSPPLSSPPKSELTVTQVTQSETTSVSTEPQTQPSPTQPGATFSPQEQSATSEERSPGNVPLAYLHDPANPNGLVPPHIPNYNAIRPEDRYRYFGPPLRPSYPVNYDPRLRLPNQQNLPPYYNFPYPYPSQRPVPPPMNRIIDDRQIIGVQPGREMGVPSDGHTFRQQTEERFLMDSRPDVPIWPETGSRPFESQPAPENQLRNPLLQAVQSHLVAPLQEHQDQHAPLPGRSDQNEPLALDRKNGSQIYNAPAGPWNPGPATNFVNLQQNTALDAPRGVLQPHPHALVPDQTIPSNEPDPASTRRSDYMDSPLRNSFYADRMRPGSGPERF